MHILVTGAYGFIGREICRVRLARGHRVSAAGRDLDLGRRLLPDADWLTCDFNEDVTTEAWMPRLRGVDAVINCVGVLQSTRGNTADQVHYAGAVALFKACAATGVKRLIYISAMSAEPEIQSEYSRSMPSLVVGAGSHGGTSLLRGLAGLPLVTPLPGTGRQRFQPIDLSLAIPLTRCITPVP